MSKSEAEKEDFTTVYTEGDSAFYIAKHMDCMNQDIVDANCVLNDADEHALNDKGKIKVWIKSYAMLLKCQA